MTTAMPPSIPGEVTRILGAISGGDPRASETLLPLVYDELRRLAYARMALEAPGQTLQPTALVHEAYLRLIGDGLGAPFFAQRRVGDGGLPEGFRIRGPSPTISSGKDGAPQPED